MAIQNLYYEIDITDLIPIDFILYHLLIRLSDPYWIVRLQQNPI